MKIDIVFIQIKQSADPLFLISTNNMTSFDVATSNNVGQVWSGTFATMRIKSYKIKISSKCLRQSSITNRNVKTVGEFRKRFESLIFEVKINSVQQTISMWIVLLSTQIAIGFRYDDNHISNNNQKTGDWEVEPFENTPENTIEPDGPNNFNIDEIEAKEKRQNDHLKHGCGCPAEPKMFKFDDTFPEFINGKVCDTNANTNGICKFNYQCKETLHKTLVLKKKINLGDAAGSKYKIPKKIKDDFYWSFEVRLFSFRAPQTSAQ